MTTTCYILLMLLGGLTVTCAGVAVGQAYPNKVIRILTAAHGSTNDLVARVIAQGLAPSLGQQVIVENRGTLAAELTARAEPDGHVLLFYGSSVYLLPLMRAESYDPVKDLAPITSGVSQVTVLAVHPSLPVKSVREFIDLAKARPGQLNYGAGTLGASPHLATEQFKVMAGVNIVHVPYKGTGPSVIALYSGEVVVMFVGMGSVAQHIRAGRLRALAITSAKPSRLAPGLPTVGETVPGYEFESEIGMYAPGRTPAAVVNLLNREIVRILQHADVKERLAGEGIEVIANTSQEYAAHIKSDMESKRKLLKAIGMLRS